MNTNNDMKHNSLLTLALALVLTGTASAKSVNLSLTRLDDITGTPGRPATLTGCVKSSAAISGYTITVLLDGNDFYTEDIDQTFTAGKSIDFEVDLPALDDPIRGTLTATVTPLEGDTETSESDNTATCNILLRKTRFTHNVVVEEATGTWCQFCPRGLVGMNYMTETYPDRFIGIGVHYNDKYAVSAYTTFVGALSTGLPGCRMDRHEAFDPNKDELEKRFKKEDTRADAEVISIGADIKTVDDVYEVTATANVHFAYNMTGADFRVVFVVTEDGIVDMQSNRYAYGDIGTCGGFEKMSNPCEVGLPDVARALEPQYQGNRYSLPKQIVYGETYSYTRTFQLPAGTGDPSNLHIIALIVDMKTSDYSLVNAKKVAFSQATGIQDLWNSGTPELQNSTNPQLHDSAPCYDLSGRIINDPARHHGIVIQGGKKYFIK